MGDSDSEGVLKMKEDYLNDIFVLRGCKLVYRLNRRGEQIWGQHDRDDELQEIFDLGQDLFRACEIRINGRFTDPIPEEECTWKSPWFGKRIWIWLRWKLGVY